LQHKPAPNSQADVAGDADIMTQGNGGKVFDPFAPPYNVNLLIGDLKDEEAQEEFVVLVSPPKPFQKGFTTVFDI